MPRISAESLRAFSERLIEATGAPPDVAEKVAESLVLADLAGHHSHGTLRIPTYTNFVEEGMLDPTATPEVEDLGPSLALVDGNFLFGQVVGRHAVEAGVERAKETGVAVVGIRNGSHLGRMGEWAERTTEEGLVFASFTNDQGHGQLTAPAGSTERKLGTNPITFGVPTFGELPFPIVLDMATSQVAHGKISERMATGREIPVGWTVDEDGSDLTDPVAYEESEGALRPLGGEISGYKGYGLGVVAELFAGIIGGGPVGGMDVEDDPWSNGSVFFVVDPARFLPEDEIVERIATLAAYLKDAEQSPNVSAGAGAKGDGTETLLPGEGEHYYIEEGREEGIDLDRGLADRLSDLAREQGVEDAIPPEF